MRLMIRGLLLDETMILINDILVRYLSLKMMSGQQEQHRSSKECRQSTNILCLPLQIKSRPRINYQGQHEATEAVLGFSMPGGLKVRGLLLLLLFDMQG